MEQSQLDAMSAAMSNKSIDKTETVVEPIVEESKAEEAVNKAIETASDVSNKSVESTEVAATETKSEPAKAEPITVTKSLDDYLTERTAGKFKKWEDIEKVINTPSVKFANDNIRHWNELAEKGIELNEEFFELQRLDVDKLKDPSDILLQAMKRKPEYKGLSESTLKLQINKKYNISEWKDKESDDFTDEDKMNQEIYMRDAHNESEWLTNLKKERTFSKQPDPELLKQQQAEAEAFEAKWEKFVDDDLYSKVTNLSTVVDESTKEAFEYKISETDRKEVANQMKLLSKDVNVIFNQFLEKDSGGNVQLNHRKVYEMLIKNKVWDEAIKHAFNDAKALGALKEVKAIKNINFSAGDKPNVAAHPKTKAEALAAELRAKGHTF